MPRPIRSSPTSRKPAKKSTIRCSACRSCATTASSASSWCRTRPAASIWRRRSRRSRPSPRCWPGWSPRASCRAARIWSRAPVGRPWRSAPMGARWGRESTRLNSRPSPPLLRSVHLAYETEIAIGICRARLGWPILLTTRGIGFLVVENLTRRQYMGEGVEALETSAMVLAGMVASGQLSGSEDLVAVTRAPTMPFRADGRTLSEGLAIGTVVLHEPRIHVDKTIADDIPHEKQRLDAAVASMRDQVDRMLEAPDSDIVGESRDVMDTSKR